MAGQQQRVLSLLVLAALALPALGQEVQEQPAGSKRLKGKLNTSPELENVKKAIEALTPEQRKRFQENFTKWANLSPEEKRALRDRDEIRRKRMVQDIERAIQTAGLQLDDAQRVQFAKRYTEERRKLEEQLRKEMEEKRQPGIADIVTRLKQEFSGGTPAQSVPATAAKVESPNP
jgi:hypothetical protein